MQPNDVSRQRRPLRVLIAVALVVALNGAVFWAWANFLPQIPLFASAQENLPQDTTSTPDMSQAAFVTRVPQSADELLSALMSATPTPVGGWRILPEEPTNLSPVFNTACSSETRPRFPALQGQKAWTPSGEPSASQSTEDSDPEPVSLDFSLRPPGPNQISSGVVQQALIYPAGVGAVAFRDIQNIIADCYYGDGWTLSYTTPLALGTESLSAVFATGSDSQEVVVFRFGDVLGIVMARNYTGAQDLAAQWASSWPALLKETCLDLDSNLEDASRQPILANFYKPYKQARVIQLSDMQRAQIEGDEEGPARERAIKAFEESQAAIPTDEASALPPAYSAPATQRMDTPGTTIVVSEMPTSDYGLAVTLTDVPAQPVPPVFPAEAWKERKVLVLAEDVIGPGCGWALLSQQPPIFDAAAAEADYRDAVQRGEAELVENFRQWVRQTWDYAIAYSAFAQRAYVWNAWTALAAQEVAKADWLYYDNLAAEYQEAVTAYQEELASVLQCERELADAIREINENPPTPSPSPSVPGPSPSPSTPVLPECAERPIPPTPPTPPTRDRPAGMPVPNA